MPHMPHAISIVSKIYHKMEQDKDAKALPETENKKDQEETRDEPNSKRRRNSLKKFYAPLASSNPVLCLLRRYLV